MGFDQSLNQAKVMTCVGVRGKGNLGLGLD